MKLYSNVIGCSCYTCLPRTAPAAAQSAQKMAPGTGTRAPQLDQRLLTNTWPKQCIKIARKTKLQLFYALQRSRGYKERLKRS